MKRAGWRAATEESFAGGFCLLLWPRLEVVGVAAPRCSFFLILHQGHSRFVRRICKMSTLANSVCS